MATKLDELFPVIKQYIEENSNHSAKSVAEFLSTNHGIKLSSAKVYYYDALKKIEGRTERKKRNFEFKKTDEAVRLIKEFSGTNTEIDKKEAIAYLDKGMAHIEKKNTTALFYHAIGVLGLAVIGGNKTKRQIDALGIDYKKPLVSRGVKNTANNSSFSQNNQMVILREPEKQMIIQETKIKQEKISDEGVEDIPDFLLKSLGYSSQEEYKKALAEQSS